MSKSNVNPNHYKVAGRERQGEGILQERHKQKHARSLTRERFESRAATARPPGPARPAALPKPAPTPTAKSPAKPTVKSPATPTVKSPAKSAAARTRGAKKRAVAKTGPVGAARPRSGSARKTPAGTAQASQKRGARSTAQKAASSRHDFGPIPATRPVAGAFGKEPSSRKRSPRRG